MAIRPLAKRERKRARQRDEGPAPTPSARQCTRCGKKFKPPKDRAKTTLCQPCIAAGKPQQVCVRCGRLYAPSVKRRSRTCSACGDLPEQARSTPFQAACPLSANEPDCSSVDVREGVADNPGERHAQRADRAL